MDDLELIKRSLKESDKSISQIASESGLPKQWLYKFCQGAIADPGHSKIMALARYFRAQRPDIWA